MRSAFTRGGGAVRPSGHEVQLANPGLARLEGDGRKSIMGILLLAARAVRH
jgi:hypothetical protein